MQAKDIVFESPTRWHKWLIQFYLYRGYKVWVIEPFHAFHHKEKGRAQFFPLPLPGYVWELIRTGKIFLLDAASLNPGTIYPRAADQAVKTIDAIYPQYRKHNLRLISFVCETLRLPKADEIFRKMLCEDLAKYYSINIS